MNNKNSKIIQYFLIVAWTIVLIINLSNAIHQNDSIWWLPYLWIVASGLNIVILISRIRKIS